MDYDYSEAEFSRVVIRRAEKTIIVADHSKFGRRGLVRVCDLERIDTVITDRPLPDPFAKQFKKAGVNILAGGGEDGG